MQKGVFSTWLKELCALVFIQTIQAFVLAIVLSIMLTFLLPYKDDGGKAVISSQAQVSALGVLCIVLLTSLTKMEQIVKKIFGLESGLMKEKPPHGLMTSFLALKAAGRALNNIPKIATGAGKVISGKMDVKKAQNRNLTRLARAGIGTGGSTMSAASQNAGENSPALPEGENQNAEAGANGRTSNSASGNNAGSRSGAHNRNASSRPAAAAVPSAASAKSSNKDINKDYWKIMDKYDDEIDKAKEKRREGLKEMASGLSETVGSINGAIAGAAVGLTSGLSTGDLDQIPKAIGFGVGAGDRVGEMTVNAVDSVRTNINTLKKNRKTINELNDNLAKMERNLQIQRDGKVKAATRFKAIQEEIKRSNSINDI